MELVTDSAEDIKSNLPKKGKATRAGRKVKKEKQVDEPAPEPENDITTDTKTIVNIIDLKQETNAKNKNSNINQLPVIEKQLELEFDIGSLMASDPNEISVMSYRSNPANYMKKITQENTQLLINKIWQLPFERVDDVVIAKLPKPTYVIPREKPVPKPKGLTKWQAYAKEKGITKRKKTKLVWDDIVNAYVPRFGYKRAAAEHEKDWVLEVPQNADPYEDQFEKKSEAKSERVAKNELQRLKNIARSRKVDIPSAGLIQKTRPSKTELNQAMHVAKQATASLGKFQQKLPKEKPLKKTGVKRHFEPLVRNSEVEKSSNLQVLENVMQKKPKIQLEKAYTRVMQKEMNSGGGGDDDDDDSPKGKRGKKAGGGRGGKGRGKKGNFEGGGGAKNSRTKKGSAKTGSFKKGRSAPRSKPKKKKH